MSGKKSSLLLKFLLLLVDIKPKYFLLENVKMGKEDSAFISRFIGCEPVEINSSDFSAQLRKRLYWTNIKIPTLPSPSLLTIGDILNNKESIIPDDSYMIVKEGFQKFLMSRNIETLKTETKMEVDVSCEKNKTRANRYRIEHIRALTQKCRCLTTQGGNMASTSGSGVYVNGQLRSLLPEEAERLQTLPEGYTKILGKIARFKVIGDGWTVDVITHIFKGLKAESRHPVLDNDLVRIKKILETIVNGENVNLWLVLIEEVFKEIASE